MKFKLLKHIGFLLLASIAVYVVLIQAIDNKVEAISYPPGCVSGYKLTFDYMRLCNQFGSCTTTNLTEAQKAASRYRVYYYTDSAHSHSEVVFENYHVFQPTDIQEICFPVEYFGLYAVLTSWDPSLDITSEPFQYSHPYATPVDISQAFQPTPLILTENYATGGGGSCIPASLASGSVSPPSGNSPLTVNTSVYYYGDDYTKSIDWGDGTVNQMTSHTYTLLGTYTVKSRTSTCGGDYTPWVDIGTVTLLPSCTAGSFSNFVIEPDGLGFINEDISIDLSAYDDCGDPVSGISAHYDFTLDPNGSPTSYQSGDISITNPYTFTLTEDGIYELEVSNITSAYISKPYRIDKTPPIGYAYPEHPAIDPNDPSNKTETIHFHANDPLINNARSGLASSTRFGITANIFSEDLENFSFKFIGLLEPAPFGNTIISCSGDINGNSNMRIYYPNASHISNVSCFVDGDSKEDFYLDITFDVNPDIVTNANNEVHYDVANFSDKAGNLPIVPLSNYFTIGNGLNYSILITNPQDNDSFPSGSSVNFSVIEVTHGWAPGSTYTYLWNKNVISGTCPDIDNPALKNATLSSGVPNIGASCEYTIEGTIDDGAGNTATANDTVTITFVDTSVPPGFVDTEWDLALDNDPPELDIATDLTDWQNEPYELEGSAADDDVHDVGINDLNGIRIASIMGDNNAVINPVCSSFNIDMDSENKNADWDLQLTDACALHRSSSEFPEEEHPIVDLSVLDRVGNTDNEELQLCYDTVAPYVSHSSPQDEQMIFDLNTSLTVVLTEPINTSLPLSQRTCDHCFVNMSPHMLLHAGAVRLYDITNGTVNNEIEGVVDAVSVDYLDDKMNLTLIIDPDEPLEKLRTYQLRINSYWNGSSFVPMGLGDTAIGDCALNYVYDEITFNTMSPPDILRIEKSIDSETIHSNMASEMRTVTLTLYPDTTSTLRSDIDPSEEPYYLTDLLPPYFEIPEGVTNFEYIIYDKDGNVSQATSTIQLDTTSRNDTPDRGNQLIWMFEDDTGTPNVVENLIPWGGRLELQYPVSVNYDIL